MSVPTVSFANDLTATRSNSEAFSERKRSVFGSIAEHTMQVSFQSPVAGLIGKLEYNGKFYIRKIHGKYILQRCPNRQNHIPTPHEKANQQQFIQQYRRLRRGDGSQASGSVADGRDASLEIKDKEI